MSGKNRLNIYQSQPKAIEALAQVEALLGACGLDAKLKHLVKLRASQINGCAYCVNMHSKEARDDGETNARLDHLVVWRNVDMFSAAEKAALAWTEAMTKQGTGADLDRLHGDLIPHFTQDEIDLLTLVIVMINAWNRIQVANSYPSF